MSWSLFIFHLGVYKKKTVFCDLKYNNTSYSYKIKKSFNRHGNFLQRILYPYRINTVCSTWPRVQDAAFSRDYKSSASTCWHVRNRDTDTSAVRHRTRTCSVDTSSSSARMNAPYIWDNGTCRCLDYKMVPLFFGLTHYASHLRQKRRG